MKVKHPRGLLLALIGSLALAAPAGAGAAQASDEMAYSLVKEIEQHRAQTWHWPARDGDPPDPDDVPRAPGRLPRACSASCEPPGGRVPCARASGSSARRTDRPWLCIHRFEGAWNDPNAPYYGGLQMDISVPAHLRPLPPAAQGHGKPLDAGRADVGGREGPPRRPRVPPVAEHRAQLRPPLAASGGHARGLTPGMAVRGSGDSAPADGESCPCSGFRDGQGLADTPGSDPGCPQATPACPGA